MGGDLIEVKFECKEVDPLQNSQAVHISPYSSGTVVDSEKVQLTQIESQPWAYQRTINQGRTSPLIPQNGFIHSNLYIFRRNFDKNH